MVSSLLDVINLFDCFFLTLFLVFALVLYWYFVKLSLWRLSVCFWYSQWWRDTNSLWGCRMHPVSSLVTVRTVHDSGMYTPCASTLIEMCLLGFKASVYERVHQHLHMQDVNCPACTSVYIDTYIQQVICPAWTGKPKATGALYPGDDTLQTCYVCTAWVAKSTTPSAV